MKFVDNGFPDTFVPETPIGLGSLTCQAVIFTALQNHLDLMVAIVFVFDKFAGKNCSIPAFFGTTTDNHLH